MFEKFQKHLTQNLPFLLEQKLIVAISGGIDSVVLAHLLYKMKADFALAHCNFQLRYDDSDKDEFFVQKLANEFDVPCYKIRFETKQYATEKGQSIQMAARELRYVWFEKLLKKHKYDYVLTAHHADDNIETVLINLTRGASIEGLTGIPMINGDVIRPLLPFSRSEIEEFTITNNIIWREDESNQSTKYFRNKIRHKVIPVLKELNENLLQTFNENLGYLNAEKQALFDQIEEVKKEACKSYENRLEIDIKSLKKHKAYKVYLYHILKGYNFSEWANIADLLDAQPGKYLLSKTHRLIKDRGILILEENNIHLLASVYKINENFSKIDAPVSLNFDIVSEADFSLENTIFVDADTVTYPLRLRKKIEGDFFFPFGMKGKKKLSKYFKDEKMSLIDKENSWLLCNNDDSIIWVVGKRMDNRFKITATTKKILKITLNY